MNNRINRREFGRQAFLAAGVLGASGLAGCKTVNRGSGRLYDISLAQWSLNRQFFGGKLDALNFAKVTKEEFDLDAIEYVNQFFKDKANDEGYLGQLKSRAADHGVKSLLIMVDGEGSLGHGDKVERNKAVENHHKWLNAAKFLGCHSIRVNAATTGNSSYEEKQKLAADGLRSLSEYGATLGLNVIVENHGGLSSDGAWLAAVMRMVDLPNCGTLPDFGNFHIGDGKMYDRYKGVAELMPFAKAVSAKSHDFDEDGKETQTDYQRMMGIVLAAGYRGYVGIEYEGSKLDAYTGIKKTKQLLEIVRDELS
ncbi:MAG TPA: sugar phosphate isomerase/epimerase family protein [Verrucomicrobiota bacterium]|jgi:sugar phosphate isomerase/epimerase|nr:sugar phosphate isomerase/epimerase family protein [Verrucomicrobiota bacterium]